MTHRSRALTILCAICCLLPLVLAAQTQGRKAFGKANPFTLEQLPDGELKTKIRKLKPKARANAIRELHKVDFGRTDAAKNMRADEEGFIYIQCPGVGCDGCDHDHHNHNHKKNTPAPAPIDPGTESAAGQTDSDEELLLPLAAPVPIIAPPIYNSRPGSTKHIYLDFNGGIVTGKAWNNVSGAPASWDCKPYDKDGDPNTFSDFEQTEIRRIWERMAEDFAPFDINITTDYFYDPENTSANRYTGSRTTVGWCIFTPGTDKSGVNLPHSSSGGIAYVNVWGTSTYPTRQPAFSFDYPSEIAAEVGSHEMGHNLGLSHDGTNDGFTNVEYYYGHNAVSNVAPAWAPIMGAGYGRNVTQWSKASEYYLGNRTQDDLAILASKVGYLNDDYGNSFATTFALGNGSITQKGIIERTNDPDFFSFISGPGTLTLNSNTFRSENAAWGGNLDILLELYDANQNLIISDNPGGETNATISRTVTGGTYYLVVKPTGAGTPLANPPSGYTAYSSLGQYTITGTIPERQPEIVVEQPVNTNLTDGTSTVNAGNINLGSSSAPITFTIRNTGQTTLADIALSKTGTHSADFAISSLTPPSVNGLEPGASATFTVTFTPSGAATRTATLRIASNDLDESPFDINLTGFGVPLGTLTVTEENFTPSGAIGGPFSPDTKTYTLTNIGSTSINWTAAKSATWLDLSTPTSGTLSAGATTTLTVSLNSQPSSLAIGSYSDTLTFTNTTNGNGNTTRAVNLTVTPIPVTIAIGNLLQYFDGNAKPVSVTATPNVAYSVTYNGSATVPSAAGSYNVVVTVTDPQYSGTASATHNIAYQVTYNGNGNSSGTAPASQTKFRDTSLTLATNSGNLIKSGATFAGWNTNAAGTGTDYPAGASYTGNASITLFAKWTAGGNGTWLPTNSATHNWSDTTKWSGGTVASGTDNTAYFTPNITATQVATLDSPRTIGNITFTDTNTSSHNLTISGSNILTLSRTTGSPVVDVTQSDRTLTISSQISGTTGLQKNGPGVLALTNISNNFAGEIVLNGGTLSATTNTGTGHFGNNPVTVNADSTIFSSGSNVAPQISGLTLNNASTLTIDANGGALTVTGPVTGSAGVLAFGSGTGGKTLNLNSLSNTFTVPIEYRSTSSSSSSTINLNSINDSAAPGQGNIRFGVTGTNPQVFAIGSAAAAPIEFNNRRFELVGNQPTQPSINNNSAQALTINTDLLVSGGTSSILNFGGSGNGINTFAGKIENSPTPSSGTTHLAVAYSGGATAIRLASVNGIAVGAAISGSNIPAGTTVTAVNPLSHEVTLSAATTNPASVGTTITVTGVISNVSVTKNGIGTWTLSNPNNTFTGPITVSPTNTAAGTLAYASAPGTNPVFFNHTSGVATLRYIGAGQTMSGVVDASSLTSGTITLDASGTGPINYSNTSSLTRVATSNNARNLILSGTNTGNNIFAGAFTNNVGSSNAATFAKNGPGTWILTGANAHTGTTSINEGKLFINGNQTNATGNVTVAANATLSGTGTIGGNTTIETGGILEFNLSTPAASHDKLDLAATRTLIFSGSSILNITTTGGASPGDYTLLTAPGGISGSLPLAVNLPPGWAATLSRVGNNLILSVTNAAAPGVPSITVSPTDSYDATGLPGGSFTPGTRTYQLTNTGTNPLNWTATDNITWLDLSPASGTLVGGASVTVTATINTAANSLSPGTYDGTLTFTNTTNSNGNTTLASSLTVRTPLTYTVTYNGNGNTSGTAPANQTKTEDTPLTLAGLGTLFRTGHTFTGWNTAANGSGTAYAANASYTANAALSLFAQWTPSTYTVTFDPNGGGTPSPTTKSVTYGSTYGTLATITRPGFTFNGWFTATTGGTQITATTPVSITGNQTLFAQWTANIYTVTFDSNGGTAPSPATKSVTFGSNYGTLATTTRSGFSFNGWFTASTGGTEVTSTTAVTNPANHTLYAQWILQESVWLPTASGTYNWGNPSSWVGGNIASGADWTAFFTPNITGAQIANLDAPRTIGNITFTDSTTSSHDLTISGSNILTLSRTSGTPTISVTQADRTLTIASEIAGTLGFTKTGSGTLALSAANTYTGTTFIDAGTLNLSGNRTAAAGQINVRSGATLGLSNGTFSLGTNTLFVGQTSGTSTVNHTAGTLSTGTTGNQLLIGNGFTGIYNLSGGTLNLNSSTNTRGILLGVNPNAGGTFNLSGTGNLNMVSSAGLLIGRSDAAANNTTNAFNQTGGTATIGTLRIGGASGGSIGVSSTLHLTGGTFTATAFDRLAFGGTNTALIHIGGSADVTLPTFPTTALGTGSTATIEFNGGVLKNTALSTNYLGNISTARILSGGAKFDTSLGDLTLSHNLLTDTTSTGGGLTKEGTNTLTLTGTNTYTGTTAVTAGKLLINGNQSAATGALNVAAAATLGGTGIIGGNTTIATNGQLEFNLSTLAASHDKLELASGKTLTFSGASTLTITTTGGAAPGSYVLLTAPGGITGSTPALNLPPGWIASVAISGNDLVLNVTNASAPTVPFLAVTPVDSYNPTGLPGGSFTPATRDYQLSNPSTNPLNWTAIDNVAWLDLAPASGTLAGGETVTVTATINTAANSLTPGTYNGTLTFTNTTNGNGNATLATALTVRTPETYPVTFDGNGNTGGSAPTDQTKTEDLPLTLSGPATLVRTGYTFNGWNTEATGSGTAYAAGGSYTANAALSLFAQWTPNTFTVTFDPNGGDTPSPTTTSVTYAATYGTLATVTRAGHTFNGWFTAPTGGTQVTSATLVSITENQTLFAQWTPNIYTVTFDANGGITASPTSKSVTFGSNYGTLATTTRSGFSFNGWFTAATGGTEITATTLVTISENHTLYAQWGPLEGTWLPTAGGTYDWGNSTSWVAGKIATGTDWTALFTPNITGPQIANLEAPRTIGNITFTDTTTSSHDLTISGANILTLSRSSGFPTINVTQADRTLTISSEIAGTQGLQKTGPGTLTLSGANTYTLNTLVIAGTLNLTGNRTAPSGPINVRNGATLNISNGNFSVGASAFFVGQSAGSSIVNHTAGTISTGTTGDQLLIGNGFAGTYHFSGGNLNINSNPNGRGIILGVNNDGGGTFNLSGTASLTMAATASLQIGRADGTGNNTTNAFNQTGGTARIGILRIGGNTSGSTGVNSTLRLTGGTFSANAFDRLALGNTNTALIHIGGTADVTLPAFPSAALGTSSTATIEFNGGVLKNAAPSTNYLGNISTARIFSGGAKFDTTNGNLTLTHDLLTDYVSTGGGLTKEGTNTLTLTGTNTYTGPTTVTAGKLFIHGNQSAATGNVNVSATATLGGTGSIGGNTTIATDGQLEFNLSTPAASHDKLELASGKSLTFSGASTLTITNTSGTPAPGSYVLLTAPGGITGNAPATLNLPTGWLASVSIIGNDLVLNLSAIPGTVATFAITGIPEQATLGTPINGITLTAKDPLGNTATSFTGNVTFGGTAGVTGTTANFVAGVLTGVSITPTTAGPALTITVNDGANHTGTATLTVFTPYQNWAEANGLTGADSHPSADYDNDGVTNLREYAFGLNPKDPFCSSISLAGNSVTSPGSPTVSVQSLAENNTDIRAVFTRRKNYQAAGLTYTVQFASKLGEWVTINTAPNILADEGNSEIEAVFVQYPQTLSTSNGLEKPRFFRVGVTLAE